MPDALLARPASSPCSRGPARRSRAALAAALAVLALLGAACSDDSDGGDEADRSTTTPTTETGSTDSTTTTIDNSQGRPLNETEELTAALAEPGVFGEGLAADPTSVGDGSFQVQLCPDQEVEVTWDDQASQGLLRTGGAGTLIVRQSVLAFPDAETADAFVDGYLEGVRACNPAVQVEDLTGIGENGKRFTAATDGSPASAAGAFVRVGTHVVSVESTGDPAADLAAVVSDGRLTTVAGLLPS